MAIKYDKNFKETFKKKTFKDSKFLGKNLLFYFILLK